MFKRRLNKLSNPLSKALLKTVPIQDPWERFEKEVPISLYGLGAVHDFSWYLEGESHVDVRSLQDLIAWLSDCTYSSDPEIFQEPDFWQHPCTFEKFRIGDCEDYALWAWRKLIELGYQTEFIAGRCRSASSIDQDEKWETGHAWVQYTHDTDQMVLDATGTENEIVIQPLEQVRNKYYPEVSVDRDLKRYVYGGYYLLRAND